MCEGGIAAAWMCASGAAGAGRAARRLGCRLAGLGLAGGCALRDAFEIQAVFGCTGLEVEHMVYSGSVFCHLVLLLFNSYSEAERSPK